MANKILPRRSYTSGATPQASDLATHEIAINWADGKAFTKNAAGNIVTLTMGGSGGGGLSWSSVPATATATGTAGQMAYDGSYVYVCVQTNVWVRSPLTTWGVDAYPTSTSLLLHFDGSLTDSSLSPKTVTAVGNAAATGAAKYGLASLALDGDGDGLTLSDGLPRGVEDWTVEFWAYKSTAWTGESSNRQLYEWADNSLSGGVSCYLRTDGNLRVGKYGQGDWYMDYSVSGLSAATWYHIAVTRSGSTMTLWINGTAAQTGSYSGSFGSTSGLQSIGCGSYMGSYGATSSWPGRIDDFRVTRGVARYTSTFTPPTIAHPDPIQPPVISISAQPSNQTASSGAATFSVTASVTLSGTLAYQWQKSVDSGSTWTNVSGATSSSLALTSQTSSNNGDQYRVVVSSTGATSVTSSAATLTVAGSFTATAVLLTSGTSYTVPTGATSMKAWVVGGGGSNGGVTACGGAGGCAYKTWSGISGGASVTYSVGAGGLSYSLDSAQLAGGNTTVTFSGVTITGRGGAGDTNGGTPTGGGYSGGDGGANGGNGSGNFWGSSIGYGGAVGGNGTPVATCNRKPMTDISGLKAALALAEVSTTETCAASAAFGSGCAGNKYGSVSAGIGGGGAAIGVYSVSGYGPKKAGGSGAVILYFT